MVHIDTDITSKPSVVQLRVHGQLDLSAVGVFGEAVMRATRLRWPVELDLAEVDFIDGSGLSMLINAANRARLGRRELTIVEISACVRYLIEITDTADRLPLLSAVAEGRREQADEHLARRALEGVETSSAGRSAFKG